MSQKTIPDHTAVRVALWRALHVQVDAPPHILSDEVGLRLIAPGADWRNRPDMHPERMTRSRGSIVARARFVEDLVTEQSVHGVKQYVILGAGLDTFAQRRPEIASRLKVFEVEQPETQAWKRQRLVDLGMEVPNYLKLVPVNFEAGGSWWQEIIKAGFDPKLPAVVVSTGVMMYLTKETNAATLRQISELAPGSTFAASYILPIDLIDPEEQPGIRYAEKAARESGTPFQSFFTPSEILALGRESGLKKAACVSSADLKQKYFAGRTDGLRPGSGEEIFVATIE